jgi:DNA-binding NarL/FixJ family response regulator
MPPHVLVVDDDAAFAELLTALLSADRRVRVAGTAVDGAEAVDLALELTPDVVLMDLHLPVLDGVEATRMIRRYLPETRVVVVTSSNDPEDRQRAREAGADAFLPKSVGEEALVEAILALGAKAGAR